MQISKSIDTIRERIVLLIRRWLAQFWAQYYSVHYRLLIGTDRYKPIAVITAIASLLGISGYVAPVLQNLLEPQVADQNNFTNFRSLLLNVGSALIGAAAIAFSLVMFAMQVNVERMPHGLFQKLSSDRKILAAFLGSFLLAIFVACMSLVADESMIALAVLASLWAVALILLLILYGYRRALLLINPVKQLNLLAQTGIREMQTWARWANRMAPIFDNSTTDEENARKTVKSDHDLARLALFGNNPNWTRGAQRSIQHAVSFARRYAENGDHEVSGTALNAVVSVNHAYIQAKGKTFFGAVPFFDNSLSTDGFINATLEHLRQNVRIGISRGDEQQIEQTLQALSNLVTVYVQIDYSNEHASKTHAHIASHYLAEAVKAIARNDMADVVMEGVRLMGQASGTLLVYSGENDITTLNTEIATVASLGAVNEKYQAATITGIEQLTSLTLALIRSDTHDIQFAAEKLRENIALVAKMFLTVPELPLRSPCSVCLAPYYSPTNGHGFLARLTDLVNAAVNAKPDDEAAKRITLHIEDWSEGSYRTQKELLLLAIEKRSQFAFDVIYWINIVTKLLMALSYAPACPQYATDKLRKHANWLMYILSWIPDDKDSTSFLENYQLTEILFETALEAQLRGWDEFYRDVRRIQLEWAFKAGKHENGWHALERSVYGMATLALLAEDNCTCDALKAKIKQQIAKPDAPNKEIRDRTARNIRERAATLHREEHRYSRIDATMIRLDHQKLRVLLKDLADIVSPATAGERPRNHDY